MASPGQTYPRVPTLERRNRDGDDVAVGAGAPIRNVADVEVEWQCVHLRLRRSGDIHFALSREAQAVVAEPKRVRNVPVGAAKPQASAVERCDAQFIASRAV